MLKPITVTFLFVLTSMLVTAQNISSKTDTIVYYFRAGNEIVSTIDSAEYVRIVYPDAVRPELFVIEEIYKNGKSRLSALSLNKNLKPKFQGDYIEFFDNGKRKCMANFYQGVPKGKMYTYFPEGRLHNIVDNYTDAFNRPAQKLEECYDFAGKLICQNGNGQWIEYSSDYKTIDISGKVKNGRKIDEWIGYMPDSSKYIEIYSGGLMKSWRLFNKQGEQIEYIEKPPADSMSYKAAGYAGGSNTLYRFLAEQIRYPRPAIESRTAGRVLVNFTIAATGDVSNLRIVKGINNGCNEEAIRVLKLSSPWVPAYKNGKAVASTFTMPIAFNIYGKMPVEFNTNIKL